MTRPKPRHPILATLSGLMLSGLVLSGGAALAAVPRVVTDLPATQSLVAQVMGDLGQPAILISQGGDAHSYQMRPSEARALEQADLVIWMGAEMAPWLDHAIAATAQDRPQLALLHSEGTRTRQFTGDGDDDDEDAHGHSEGLQLDPHAWLDPANAETWLGTIAAALAKADPEHAAAYAANAKTAKAKIAALDARLSARLQPLAGRPFVVNHDAYGYYSEHFGLDDAGWVSPGDATDPGAAHLVALRKELTTKGVVCAFTEAGHDPRPMQQLIAGTGVRMGGQLDPEGAAMTRGPMLYEQTLEQLSDTIAACLEGK